MRVSNFNVFSFRFIKAPFFCSFWYVALCYTIWNPYDTLPTVLGIALLVLGFTKLRFVLGLLSPIPCIAEMIISFNFFPDIFIPVMLVFFGILWLYFYVFFIGVWRNIYKGNYVLDPVTNHLKYSDSYYLLSGLNKKR